MAKIKKNYVPGKNRNHKHHNWWKYLLCILLGQLLIIPELVIGVGTVASSITNEQLLKMLGLNPTEYLSEDVSKDTILSLVTKFIGGNYKIQSLGDISQLTPALENLYDEYSHYAEDYGVTINKEEFFSTKFEDFGDYAMNLLMDVKLGDTLEGANVDVSKIQVLSDLAPNILYKIPVAKIEIISEGTPVGNDYKIALSDDAKNFDLSESIKYYPSETTETEIKWTSSDETVAKIKGNLVEAVGNGNAVLTAKPCDEAEEKTINVEVSNFTPAPTDDPEPGTKSKSRNLHHNYEEGGEPAPSTECQHTFDENGYCTKCGNPWKFARSLGEIISMFKEKKFEKMFGTTAIGDLIPSLPEGFDALGTIQIASLLGDPMSALKDISIGAFLGGESGNPLLDTLGSFTIGDLMDPDTFNTLTIGKLLGIEDDATGIQGLLKDCSLSMDSIMGAINDAKVGDLITVNPDDTLMAALADCYIMETEDHEGIASAITTLKLGDVMSNIQEGDMLYAFKDCTIDELSTKFSSMYLYELLNTRTYVADADVGNIIDNKITVGTTTYDVLYDANKENKPYYVTATGVTKLLCESQVTTGSGAEEKTDFLNLSNMQEGLGKLMETATIRDILGDSDDQYVSLFLDCSLTNIGERITTLKIGQIMPDASSGILGALSDCYLSAVPEDDPTGVTCEQKINDLKLSDIMDGLDSLAATNPVIGLIKDKYLYAGTDHAGDTVLDVINNLTIGQAMGIDKATETNGMLVALADVSVSNPSGITDAVKSCKLSDLITIDNTSPAMLQELASYQLGNLSTAFNNIHISAMVGADQMFDNANDPQALKGIWSLMFDNVADAQNATVDQFSTCMSNLTTNIQGATLDELAAAGVVSMSQQDLDKTMIVGGARVGDLTLSAIIEIALQGAN